MKSKRLITSILLFLGANLQYVSGDNQTPDLSPILPNSQLPFTIKIEQADFSLPQGIQSFAHAEQDGKILMLCGRINGLHGFDAGPDNFPPNKQNTTVFVLDLVKGTTYSRSLLDPASGLTQEQIDLLSVTNPQHIQTEKALYITGGYGVDTATGLFSTKNCLTAINIHDAIEWVIHPESPKMLSSSIRHLFDDAFQVTGGVMKQGHDGLALLIFGQNFTGFYGDSSNGNYTQQIRRFYIFDDGKNLFVYFKKPIPFIPDPNYRRRDLTVASTMQIKDNKLVPGFVALSGVFTTTDGIWTVPVVIDNQGKPSMADPNDSSTFKQGMNNYDCAYAGLFSIKTGDMYTILFGGISFGFFQNDVFTTDSEIPFINQVTTIKINKNGNFTQYLMDDQYPEILSTTSNPGNPLLFGTEAVFFPKPCICKFPNNVLVYDLLPERSSLIGYIVGGIQSTLPNTNTQADSAASPYIFKVFLEKN